VETACDAGVGRAAYGPRANPAGPGEDRRPSETPSGLGKALRSTRPGRALSASVLLEALRDRDSYLLLDHRTAARHLRVREGDLGSDRCLSSYRGAGEATRTKRAGPGRVGAWRRGK